MTRRFVVQEKFGLWCEHLDYQHSIIPQGQFLVRREMRRFKAYFLNFPLFEKVVTSTASCPRSDWGGGGEYCTNATHPHGIQALGQNAFCNKF